MNATAILQSYAGEIFLETHGRNSYSSVDCLGKPLDHKLLERMQKKEGVFIEAGAKQRPHPIKHETP